MTIKYGMGFYMNQYISCLRTDIVKMKYTHQTL